MLLTIIPSDGAVYKNGVSFPDLQLTGVPADVHALQWHENSGWIEYNTEAVNEPIAELPQWAIDAVAKWDEASLIASEPPQSDTFYESVRGINEQYPAANIDSINSLLSVQYPNIVIAPAIRESDSVTIGVSVVKTLGYESETGLRGLLSIKSCMDAAYAAGVPLLAVIAPTENTVDKDRFAEFLVSSSSRNKIIYGDRNNYVYQDWTTQMAKNRKRALINTERTTRVNSGISWNGNIWDTADESRNNLASTLAVINAGGQLPVGFTWRTADNQNIVIDATALKALSEAMMVQTNTYYQESWIRKAALEALPADCTYAQIDAI